MSHEMRGAGFSRLVQGLCTPRRLLVCIGMIVLSCSLIASRQIIAKSPHLVLTTKHLDLGEGKPNELMRGGLTLSNSGGAPLVFSIERSCSCTVLSPGNGTVPPGGEQEIEVGISLPSQGIRTVRLVVKCNDPRNESVLCLLTARCLLPFHLKPQYVDFGQVVESELKALRPIDITVSAAKGKPSSGLDFLQVRQVGDIVDVTGPQRGIDGVWSVSVSARSPLRRGEHSGVLEFSLPDSDLPVRVPLHVEVVSSVSIIPSTVFLPSNQGSSDVHKVNVLIRAPLVHGRVPEITLSSAPEGFEIEDVSTVRRGLYRLRLLVPTRAKLSPSTEIVFNCSGINEVLRLVLASKY
ncbi:hypothetical protein [Symmachiella dynata]|uniref:Ig-like domain-containing protein n=1 Tax=Symmachiella dynata TaxID=2527995 RepID=UPI003C6EC4FE